MLSPERCEAGSLPCCGSQSHICCSRQKLRLKLRRLSFASTKLVRLRPWHMCQPNASSFAERYMSSGGSLIHASHLYLGPPRLRALKNAAVQAASCRRALGRRRYGEGTRSGGPSGSSPRSEASSSRWLSAGLGRGVYPPPWW